MNQLLACLGDESTSKLWRAKGAISAYVCGAWLKVLFSIAASYPTSKTDAPYFSYFASTTPDSDSKRTRLRTVLFLQGSKLYDPERIRARLESHEQKKVLCLELAVLLGKVRA